ncbi:MAG: hypothetical protein PUB43_06120, partial [Oscillospiraceae bacterium]|nr:hypothetical protein [Oscillospiraceae bacterium]
MPVKPTQKKQKSPQAKMPAVNQTVDKCARAHRNSKQKDFVLKFISILIFISAPWYRTTELKVSMLAVFSRLEYHRVTHINLNPFFIRRISAHSALK